MAMMNWLQMGSKYKKKNSCMKISYLVLLLKIKADQFFSLYCSHLTLFCLLVTIANFVIDSIS